MTVQDLKDKCDECDKAGADMFVLKIPGKARGQRRRVMPFVMGFIVGEYIREDGSVGCHVFVKVKDVRKAIAAHEHGEKLRSQG